MDIKFTDGNKEGTTSCKFNIFSRCMNESKIPSTANAKAEMEYNLICIDIADALCSCGSVDIKLKSLGTLTMKLEEEKK
jgi:hypothetical protein